MKNQVLIPILIFLFMGGICQAQRFGASAILGGNLSQVRGDNYAGFHRFGFHGGLKGIVYLNQRFDLNIELLFNHVGSQDGLFASNKDQVGIAINTIEIPVLIDIKDWFIDDGDGNTYAKVGLHTGVSVSQIIGYDIKQLFNLNYDGREPTSTYLNFNLGARLNFTRNIAASLRFSRAFGGIIDLEDDTTGEMVEQLPYYIALRAEYRF